MHGRLLTLNFMNKGITQIKDKWQQGTWENIWDQEGWSDKRRDDTAKCDAVYLVIFTKHHYDDQVMDTKKGGSRNKYGDKYIQKFGLKTWGEETTWKT
jgi:hypothetical protein